MKEEITVLEGETPETERIIYDAYRMLNEYDVRATGDEVRAVTAVRLDEQGQVIGACVGYCFLQAVDIAYLIVRDGERGKGLGSRLLREVEEHAARQYNCTVSCLRTLDHQAHDFYIRAGYSTIAVVRHWKTRRYYMKKELGGREEYPAKGGHGAGC